MNFSIYDTAQQAKAGDSAALQSLIEVFKPLICKYGKSVDDGDAEQELMVFLWQLLYKLPLQDDTLREDKVIFSYIATSLKRQYFKLSKQKTKVKKCEVGLPPDFALTDPHDFTRRLCLTDLVHRLNSSEYKTMVWIYDCGYSVKEIAAALHVSAQAVNQMKCRTLKKLKQFYVGD